MLPISSLAPFLWIPSPPSHRWRTAVMIQQSGNRTECGRKLLRTQLLRHKRSEVWLSHELWLFADCDARSLTTENESRQKCDLCTTIAGVNKTCLNPCVCGVGCVCVCVARLGTRKKTVCRFQTSPCVVATRPPRMVSKISRRTLRSTLWLILPIYLLTKAKLVVHVLPNTSFLFEIFRRYQVIVYTRCCHLLERRFNSRNASQCSFQHGLSCHSSKL